MRTAIALLVLAAIVLAVLAACRARDDTVADSAAGDNARADESQSDSLAGGDSGPRAASPPRTSPSRESRAPTSTIRRVEDSVRDSTLLSDDSMRAMRPKLPQVTPEKRPRAWRGFKLPEERPVWIPIEPAPDSTMKGDSIKPPKPPR